MIRLLRIARRSACAALLAVVVSTNASATTYCEGLVTSVGIDSDGQFLVSVNNFGVWSICNLKAAFVGNGVNFAPETCRAWYASVLAAQKAGTSVMLYFSTSAEAYNGAACTGIGSWVVPNPSPYYLLAK